MTPDEQINLHTRISDLEKQLTSAHQEIARLQRANKASEVTDAPVSISEFEETLKRLVQRVAMILQAEKCVIMILNKDDQTLIARNPAFGFGDADLRDLRIKASEGVAGQVFRSGEPAIFHDLRKDDAAVQETAARFNLANGVIVPLTVEKRDDDNRVMDRISIGVLCVFNKRYGGDFLDEDVTLLERLARNAAAVIANAQMYQDLVEEKQKLVHTIESLYAGLLLIGSNGNIIQMNARARQIFNVVDDPLSKPYREVLCHERASDLLKRMLEAPLDFQPREDDDDRESLEIGVVDPETDEERIFQIHPAPVNGWGRWQAWLREDYWRHYSWVAHSVASR